MRGRVCLITGGTGGIGRAIALGLAARGAEVVVVGRDLERGRRAVAALRAASGNAAVELLAADLSSQRSIRALAEAFRRRHDRLHVLVNNVGGLFPRRQLTVDGLERTFALNHLGSFLLTALLLDRLGAGAPARIVNVASNAHARGRIDLDDLQSRRRYGGLRAYRATKLANLWFTYALARRLAGSGVTVNAMHPGTTATRLGRDRLGWYKLVVTLLGPLLRAPGEAARTAIELAASPGLEGASGGYFVDGRAQRSAPRSYDVAGQERLWAVSEELTRPAGGRAAW
jgi:retinol dehydrogenase 14